MNGLYFELIRVSIGTQEHLSRLPEENEWAELLDMAVKHSQVGVCFVGLQRLGADADEGFSQIGMSEELYLDWMGLAAQIQSKNDIVDRQCAYLQKLFSKGGYRSSILKGQGAAALYGDLAVFRQSGDIDIFVDSPRRKLMQYFSSIGVTVADWDYVHMHSNFFSDTEVEVHYRPSVLRCFLTNYRLQKFFENNKDEFFASSVELPDDCGSVVVPSDWMNVFFMLQHMYRHLFTEGIGLRQLMDYYFVLKSASITDEQKAKLESEICRLGLGRFASGIAWAVEAVFGEDPYPGLFAPDKEEGEFLLNEIMQSGNFGKQDDRFGGVSSSKFSKFISSVRRSSHFLIHYPGEVLSVPFYYLWHFVWKRAAMISDKHQAA